MESHSSVPVCIHCGERCSSGVHGSPGQPFCCMGCKTVYELLNENGLGHYYKIESTPGPSLKGRETARDFGYLDTPSVRERVLDFFSEKAARATFHIPSIHCAACVWLLENLFRVHPAIGLSRVNMGTREVRLQFDPSQLPLSGLVGLLTNMGYEPSLTLRDLEKPAEKRRDRSILLRIGYAGFAFGNVMMMSFPAYLGLSTGGEALLLAWFGGLSLLLSIPVLLFSAAPFWRSAGGALRRRSLNIDFPIVTGLLALFFGSLPEILRGEGPGYLDSFTGLTREIREFPSPEELWERYRQGRDLPEAEQSELAGAPLRVEVGQARELLHYGRRIWLLNGTGVLHRTIDRTVVGAPPTPTGPRKRRGIWSVVTTSRPFAT